MAGVAEVEGRVHIALAAAAHQVQEIEIYSNRHTDACRVLLGKPVGQALAILPRLFSICGIAQGTAGMTAWEAVCGTQLTAQESVRRRLRLALETAQEHFGRLLIDWPRLFGQTGPDLPALACMHSSLRAVRDALGNAMPRNQEHAGVVNFNADALTDAVEQLEVMTDAVLLGMPAGEWLGISDAAQLQGWYRNSRKVAAIAFGVIEDSGIAEFGRCEVDLMPEIGTRDYDQLLGGDSGARMAAQPYWRGQVYETGPLARQAHWPLIEDLQRRYGNGLIVRMAARLAELVRTISDMPAQLAGLAEISRDGEPERAGQSGASGAGIGIVEAARGRLVHRMVAERGVIRDYRILAPTEWNFHPQGPLAQGLRGMHFGELAELRQRVAMLVSALDPCVAYEVVINGAA